LATGHRVRLPTRRGENGLKQTQPAQQVNRLRPFERGVDAVGPCLFAARRRSDRESKRAFRTARRAAGFQNPVAGIRTGPGQIVFLFQGSLPTVGAGCGQQIEIRLGNAMGGNDGCVGWHVANDLKSQGSNLKSSSSDPEAPVSNRCTRVPTLQAVRRMGHRPIC